MKKVTTIISLVLVLFLGTSLKAQTVEEMGALFNKAAELDHADKYDDAIAEFKKVIVMGTQLKDEQAAKWMEQAAIAIPTLKMRSGKSFVGSDLNKAIIELNFAIGLCNEYPNPAVAEECTSLLGQLYLKKGNEFFKAKQYDAAITDLDMSLSINPDNKTAWWLKFNCYRSLSKIDDMIATYNKMNEAFPGDSNTEQAKSLIGKQYVRMGNADLKAQKNAAAIEKFKLSLDYEQDGNTYASMASAYNVMKQYDNALSACESGLALNPEKPDGLYLQQGIAFFGKGDKTKACEIFKTIKTEPYLKSAKAYPCN